MPASHSPHAFAIKQGATLPTIQLTIYDQEGDALDLTDVTSVVFKMYEIDCVTAKVAAGAASVTTPATDGTVEYGWDTADTNAPANYLGEFTLTFSDGGVATFPTDDYIKIRVYQDLET